MAKKSRYIIGIDLGTTNCTLAYGELIEDAGLGSTPEIHQHAISQLIEDKCIGDSLFLPSFVFFPFDNQQPHPFNETSSFCLGTYARERGIELPNRYIHSAKSWLCQENAECEKAQLPLLSDEHKMSAVSVLAELLKHLKKSWDVRNPEDLFNEQIVYITVPASFDPQARKYVEEAAQLANYPHITLIEEPLAAFYAWIYQENTNWRKELALGDTVLVIDIGGGTTDFTLINVEETNGNLTLNRRAVGSHLLLGGDNLDLALSQLAKDKLEEVGHHIDEWQELSLLHACRKAKEQLLSDDGTEIVDITIHGRGSRLIGGTLSTTLSLKEINNLIDEGFAPLVDLSSELYSAPRSGIIQEGLQYVQDPRITTQLAHFLSSSKERGEHTFPTAVLFNGGSLKSSLLRNKLLKQLNFWAESLKQQPLKELKEKDLNFAVSLGAVYYGFAQKGRGIRVKAGANRSYFIGVETAAPAIPGRKPPLKALCLVPFGTEEGTEINLDQQQFTLLLGELAQFKFFSRNQPLLPSGEVPQVGTFLNRWSLEDLHEYPPLETMLSRQEGEGKYVSIKLKAKVTELGVLELWCVGDNERQWKLEFNLR